MGREREEESKPWSNLVEPEAGELHGDGGS